MSRVGVMALGWGLLASSVADARDAISMAGMTSVTHGEQAPYVQFNVFEPGALQADLTCVGRTWNLDQRVSAGAEVTAAGVFGDILALSNADC